MVEPYIVCLKFWVFFLWVELSSLFQMLHHRIEAIEFSVIFVYTYMRPCNLSRFHLNLPKLWIIPVTSHQSSLMTVFGRKGSIVPFMMFMYCLLQLRCTYSVIACVCVWSLSVRILQYVRVFFLFLYLGAVCVYVY